METASISLKELFNSLTIKRHTHNRNTTSFEFVPFLGSIFTYEQSHTIPSVIKQSVHFQSWLNIVKFHFKYEHYQDGNPYKFHKYVPSARGIHPLIPFFIYKGHLCIYNIVEDNIIYIGFDKEKENEIELIIGIDLWRTCSIYGSFGLALSLLDLGHVIGSMKIEANGTGQQLRKVCYMFNRSEYRNKLGLLHPNDIFLGVKLVFQCNDPVCNDLFVSKRYPYSKKYHYHDELERIGLMDFIAVMEFSSNTLIDDQYHWQFPRSLLKTGRERTSNNSYVGLMDLSKPLKTAAFEQICQVIKETKEKILYGYKFRIYFVIQHVIGYEKGLYYLDGDECILRMATFQLDEFLFYEKSFFNLQKSPFLLFFSYLVEDYEADHLKIFYSHVLAGELMQGVSRIVSHLDMYARPIRNMNDAYIKKVFSLGDKERVIYGLFAGTGNGRSTKIKGD
ncbi:hypothetical protein H1Z61_05925 [Bacillus aquiflavi]|uniref:Uncharacterized protein n=1 Tax=Bacillus aquiflavi TaxID=2672567 RepID=A0A6B3VZM7_9BACI|nr:hypothetical protein [Bacillus aquiflavi]MBA4536693.1 hypothetical protein [Bacillus aquiflavi]NEY81061.1 hypothetical protein [Bacillus aquiflavi]UAC48729.1 hypothetical protein K6959_01775 [Bacillus aquiflavi]